MRLTLMPASAGFLFVVHWGDPMNIQRVPVGQINPSPYNPRIDLHPGDPVYEKLRRSIAEFGLVEPIVWNQRTGRVVGGHQRLKVLQEMGITETEVVVVDLDDTREKALNIALNKIQGEWDMPKLKDLLEELDTGELDIEITGFDLAEVEDLLTRFTEDDEDDEHFDVAKALQEIVDARIQPGEVWRLGQHLLICGDSTDDEVWRRLLGDVKVDLIVTSPPYNVGINYATYKDSKARDEYLDFIREVGTNILLHLAPGRFVAWNVGVSPDSYPHYHVVTLEQCGLQFYRQIVWEKSGVPYPIFQTTRRTKKARHYKPNYKHEVVYVLRKEDAEDVQLPTVQCPVCDGSGMVEGMEHPVTHEMLVLMTWGEPEKGDKIQPLKKYANDVWHIVQSQATTDLPTLGTKSSGLEKGGKKSHMVKAHPAAFPVELPRAVMTFLTAEGESVLDPFCGSGSTIIAAEKMGRVAYGIEFDPIYCELAMRRWEEFTGQEATKLA
ncbi:DNA modification methylase [Alicyclobacillus macrosporangiidus]|uniref:Methyltransferase n=2 Tax=Alicyclobacillus macrosporangiidus TaxID=392015 RepID=A0A1I7FV69_9BACL|nr:DNA modification methylase [Alicyclobacillus macrosporangiidus]